MHRTPTLIEKPEIAVPDDGAQPPLPGRRKSETDRHSH
jgi:hypothetical protein